jgi:hypothetical protein
METALILIVFSANCAGFLVGAAMIRAGVPMAGILAGMWSTGILAMAGGVALMFGVHPLTVLATAVGLIGIVVTLAIQTVAAVGIRKKFGKGKKGKP